jgi:CRP-like cAMP-binding protein
MHAIVITDRAFKELVRSSPALQLKLLRSLAARLAGDEPA